jgi:dihydrodipicolinate reductase
MGQTLIEAIEQTDGVVLGVELDKGDDLSAVLDQFEVLIDFTRPEATTISISESSPITLAAISNNLNDKFTPTLILGANTTGIF